MKRKLISIFRRRADGFSCSVQRHAHGSFFAVTEDGRVVSSHNTEIQAAGVARRIAQGGRVRWASEAARTVALGR